MTKQLGRLHKWWWHLNRAPKEEYLYYLYMHRRGKKEVREQEEGYQRQKKAPFLPGQALSSLTQAGFVPFPESLGCFVWSYFHGSKEP